MLKYNPILDLADSYKLSHFAQYPKDTTKVYSYIESRGGENADTIFFGLQAFIQEYLTRPVTTAHIEEAEIAAKLHGVPFYKEGWELLVKKYNGFMPVRIRAVPEGTLVPTKNILVDVMNTDPDFYWLTSYIETALLRAVWYPTTVATRNFHIKKVIKAALHYTADTEDKLPVMLNDFGARGASSLETARLGGMGHLVNFAGTDNLAAVMACREYYGEEMAGVSIPAAEHSTMTSWQRDGEVAAYGNMVDQFADNGILAVVSDSYDIWNAVENIWGDELLEKVKNSGATVVVRPDSGDPITTPIEVIEKLMAKVGYTTNSKGFRVLPDYFRVIQGDGIGPNEITEILDGMTRRNLSADNIAFGMGGGMLQKLDRDTQKFAMKCSAIKADGKWIDVYKDPITDPGKQSKRGRMTLYRDGDRIFTNRTDKPKGWVDTCVEMMETVYECGKVTRYETLAEIRARVDANL
jgi:nicotinamide phosphoribosyltransferase